MVTCVVVREHKDLAGTLNCDNFHVLALFPVLDDGRFDLPCDNHDEDLVLDEEENVDASCVGMEIVGGYIDRDL